MYRNAYASFITLITIILAGSMFTHADDSITADGRIIYAATSRLNTTVHVHDMSTGDDYAISNTWAGTTVCPQLSSNNLHLAFIQLPIEDGIWRHGNETLAISNVMTGEYRYIYSNGAISCPQWLENGHQLVYTVEDRVNSRTNIFRYDMNSGQNQLLAQHDSFRALQFDIARDGTLVFTEVDERRGNIYAVPAQGGQITSIVSINRQISDVMFSPDDQYVSFMGSNRQSSEYYVYDRQTGQVLLVTNEIEDSVIDLMWSPDGQAFAFRTTTMSGNDNVSDLFGTGNKTYDGDIYIYNAPTNTLQSISDTPNIAEHTPIWSPDGSRLTYYATDQTWSAIELYNAANGAVHDLTENTTANAQTTIKADWAPNNTGLAFIQNGELYVHDMLNETAQHLSRTLNPIDTFGWAGNGYNLAVQAQGTNNLRNVYVMNIFTGEMVELNGAGDNQLFLTWAN